MHVQIYTYYSNECAITEITCCFFSFIAQVCYLLLPTKQEKHCNTACSNVCHACYICASLTCRKKYWINLGAELQSSSTFIFPECQIFWQYSDTFHMTDSQKVSAELMNQNQEWRMDMEAVIDNVVTQLVPSVFQPLLHSTKKLLPLRIPNHS